MKRAARSVGPQGPQVVLGRDVPWRLFGALVSLGLKGGLGNGGAHFMWRVGAPAMWSLSGEKQT